MLVKKNSLKTRYFLLFHNYVPFCVAESVLLFRIKIPDCCVEYDSLICLSYLYLKWRQKKLLLTVHDFTDLQKSSTFSKFCKSHFSHENFISLFFTFLFKLTKHFCFHNKLIRYVPMKQQHKLWLFSQRQYRGIFLHIHVFVDLNILSDEVNVRGRCQLVAFAGQGSEKLSNRWNCKPSALSGWGASYESIPVRICLC